MPPEVITLGCRLNSYESEVIRTHADAAGLADVLIVNTCAVTGEALRQAQQLVRRTRRARPDARIVVTGCGAQVDGGRFHDMPEVDHVIGNAEKMRAHTWTDLAAGGLPRACVGDIMAEHGSPARAIDGFHGRVRASVQVQNGCDHRCTFCIIPFARGPSRSVPMAELSAQVRRLVEIGCREIVLTGVDITSYGADLADRPSLGRLVRHVLREVPELPRLRLSSVDQVECDDELLAAIAEEERLMPHLHLSLQSGDDIVLKRMRRRHLRADAIAFCAALRRLRPGIALGADLIAGFPTETDDMFERTLDTVNDCGITYVHAFPFSPRPGTPAARMPQVDRTVIKSRAERLRALGRRRLADDFAARIGERVEVLVEGSGLARTPQFAPVRLAGPKLPAASMPTVRIIDAGADHLVAAPDVRIGSAVLQREESVGP